MNFYPNPLNGSSVVSVLLLQPACTRGIPEDDMVLGLQSPRIRELVAAKKQNAMLESIPFRN